MVEGFPYLSCGVSGAFGASGISLQVDYELRRECAREKQASAVLVARAAGVHPVSSRTRKLSPRAQMVLHWRRCGRVCRRQHFSRLLCFCCLPHSAPGSRLVFDSHQNWLCASVLAYPLLSSTRATLPKVAHAVNRYIVIRIDWLGGIEALAYR